MKIQFAGRREGDEEVTVEAGSAETEDLLAVYRRNGDPGGSAGAEPAQTVHPLAEAVGRWQHDRRRAEPLLTVAARRRKTDRVALSTTRCVYRNAVSEQRQSHRAVAVQAAQRTCEPSKVTRR